MKPVSYTHLDVYKIQMSNRLFQSLVHQMRDVVDRVIGVLDENSVIISCSDLSRIGEADPSMKVVLMEGHDAVVGDGYTYKTFGSHIQPEYCVFVDVYKRQPPVRHVAGS